VKIALQLFLPLPNDPLNPFAPTEISAKFYKDLMRRRRIT